MTTIIHHHHYYCSHKSCRVQPQEQKELQPREGERRFSATEQHIIEVVSAMTDAPSISRESLVILCAAALSTPEPGARDNRMVRVAAAVDAMTKGKDAPFRENGGVIHFLVD